MTKTKSKYLSAIAGIAALVFSQFAAAKDRDTSAVAKDEFIEFFRTSAWFDQDQKLWIIPIHGWIYEPQSSRARKTVFARSLEQKYGLQLSPATEQNFAQRVNLLLADNERGKGISVSIADDQFSLRHSEANGHFQTFLTLPSSKDQFDGRNILQVKAHLDSGDNRDFSGQVQIVESTGVSVISDIDDTVKISHVTDRAKLFDYTFYRDFAPVAGMPELYQSWADQGAYFHFVSSSPWQLYRPLEDFLNKFQFPWASLSLKSIRLKDQSILNLFKKGTETKPAAIRPILDRYPGHRFILVGDSGEQDAEVYAKITTEYPQQILKVLIRNIDDDPDLDAKMKVLFEKFPQNKWQTFKSPSEVDIAF